MLHLIGPLEAFLAFFLSATEKEVFKQLVSNLKKPLKVL